MALTKMRGNPDLVIAKNFYCLTAFSILVSFFAGCTAGSCLSYGHSCWGAHGKRSMDIGRPLEGLGGGERKVSVPTSYDGRWLLSRLVNRQLMQTPLAAKLRARLLDGRSLPPPSALDDRSDAAPDALRIKHSNNMMSKDSGDVDIRDIPKIEHRIPDDGPSLALLFPQQRDSISDDDQAIKMRIYKILKNIQDKKD